MGRGDNNIIIIIIIYAVSHGDGVGRGDNNIIIIIIIIIYAVRCSGPWG